MRYVFDRLDLEPWNWTPQDRRLATAMADYWTNFAKSGNPNGADLPTWLPFDSQHQRALELGDDIKMIPYPNLAPLGVLDAIYQHYRE